MGTRVVPYSGDMQTIATAEALLMNALAYLFLIYSGHTDPNSAPSRPVPMVASEGVPIVVVPRGTTEGGLPDFGGHRDGSKSHEEPRSYHGLQAFPCAFWRTLSRMVSRMVRAPLEVYPVGSGWAWTPWDLLPEAWPCCAIIIKVIWWAVCSWYLRTWAWAAWTAWTNVRRELAGLAYAVLMLLLCLIALGTDVLSYLLMRWYTPD